MTKKKARVKIPESNLPTGTGTGTMNFKMLGHATAPISSARGSREGNSALNQRDAIIVNYSMKKLCEMAVSNGLSLDTIYYILKLNDNSVNVHDMIGSMEELAIRNGHHQLARKIIQESVARGGYGFTELFCKALDDKPSFGNIKASSVVKKSHTNEKVTPLHCAAINPNVSALSQLISVNSDFNIMDNKRFKIVHYAAACKNNKPLSFLVNRGVSIDDVNTFGETPLHIACKLGRSANVECLLQKSLENDDSMKENLNGTDGDDVQVKSKRKVYITASEKYTKDGFNPLQLAAKHGHKETVETLMKFNINFEKKTRPNRECMTALLLAAEQGHLPVVKALIEGGAKIENKDRRKKSALIHAVTNGQTHVVSYLLHVGADPKTTDSSGNTVVHYAVAYGWWKCLLLVIEAGADPTTLNDWKLHPVAVALLKNQDGVVSYLLNLPDIEINFKDNDGSTLLMQYMHSVPSSELLKQMKFLIIDKKADATAIDATNNNALHYLASTSYKDEKYHNDLTKAAKLLIEHGCDPLQMNDSKYTPFHVALSSKCKPLIDVFIDMDILSKIDSNCNDKDEGLLHLFISSYEPKEHYLETFKKFVLHVTEGKSKSEMASLKKMCGIRDKKGRTPLLNFCQILTNQRSRSDQYFHTTVLQLLLEDLKCDPNELQTCDHTSALNTRDSPLHVLASNNISYAIDVLTKFKPNLNSYNREGRTPLLCAIASSVHNLNAVKSLIQGGADVNLKSTHDKDESSSPLLLAASRVVGESSTIYPTRYECNYGDSDEDDDEDQNEDSDNDEGDNVNESDNDNEYDNVNDEDDKTNESDNEVDENDDCNKGQPFIMLQELVSNNADLAATTKISKKTALHFLVECHRNDALLSLIRHILDTDGSIINNLDQKGRTALHCAVGLYKSDSDSFTDVEELLLEYGADPLVLDHYGRLALHYAFLSLQGNNNQTKHYCDIDPIEMVSILIGAMKGKYVNLKDDNGWTCLHCAASCGATVSCMFLCHRMKDINPKNNIGNTPLGIAVMQGKENFSLMMLHNRSDINVKITTEKKKKEEKPSSKFSHRWLSAKDDNDDFERPLLQEIVKRDWQGVLYTALMMIEDTTKNYNDVIQAALIEKKYNLVLKLIRRTYNRMYLHEKRKYRQNFLHQLAITSKDNNRPDENYLITQVAKAFINKGVSLTDVDEFKTLPIIYAAQEHNYTLCKLFANEMNLKKNKYAVNPDFVGRTIVSSICMLSNTSNYSSNSAFGHWIRDIVKDGALTNVLSNYPNMNIVTKHLYPCLAPSQQSSYYPNANDIKGTKVSPLIYSIACRDKRFLKQFLELQPSLNFTCDDGLTPLMYAVIQNDIKIVKILLNKKHEAEYEEYLQKIRKNELKPKKETELLSIKRIVRKLNPQLPANIVFEDALTEEDKHFVMKSSVDFNIADKNKKTVLHHLLSHFEFGSYDNLRMLQFLMCNGLKFEYEDYFPYLENGAIKIKKFLETIFEEDYSVAKVQSGFIVRDTFNFDDYCNNHYSYEEDSCNAIKAINPTYFQPEKVTKPNKRCECAENGEVVFDPSNATYYSVRMHKMDIDYGVYGFYNFYVMQVVYDKAKEMYFLFTKWGRIGSMGQWQNTPFSTKEECLKEFHKVFKAKSGNDWSDLEDFEKKPFKYRLMNTVPKKEVSISGMNISLAPSDKTSKLPHCVKEFLLTVSNVQMLQNGWRKHKIDNKSAPFGFLNRSNILDGESILREIRTLHDELKQLNKKFNQEQNVAPVISSYRLQSYEIYKKIEELSEKFYELIPVDGYQDDDIIFGSIYSEASLSKMTSLVEQLLDLDITSKLVLGAYHRLKEIHPMDYIYQSLKCEMELLDSESHMSQYILQYIHFTGHKAQVESIFKIAQKGHDEAFNKLNMGNHRFLWHGTRLENVIGILSQGLRVCPLNAEHTGQAFGEGIYFSDNFGKSYGYTDNWITGDRDSFRVMFLCEAALGKAHKFDYDEDKSVCDSIMVDGGVPKPEHDFTLPVPYGAVIPLGSVDRYSSSEYVVPDSKQVCIRFMVLFR